MLRVVTMAPRPLNRPPSAAPSRKSPAKQVPSVRLTVKRVYEPAAPGDGLRVLVDRLWPRGLSKANAAVDLWLRDIAPSAPLREWFNHDPARWAEFRRRYAEELDGASAVVGQLLAQVRQGPVTLLYSAHHETCNNAVALCEYVQPKLRRRASA